MALYRNNLPSGLTPVGHLISGTDNINFNSNYLIDTSAGISAALQTLNFGDPIMISSLAADYAVRPGYNGKDTLITLYKPIVTLAGNGNPNAVAAALADGINAGTNKTIAGVFQGCTFIDPTGMIQYSKYFTPGMQKVGTEVRATIIDDPYVIYSIQLGTYMGSLGNAFLTAPVINNVVTECVIGSNLELCVDRGPVGGVAGGSTLLNTIEGSIHENPVIGSNGVSAFYACPSIAANIANPSAHNEANQYPRANSALKLLGFMDASFANNAWTTDGNAATYFNVPFLNVKVLINNHVNKASTPTAVLV